MKQKKYWLFLSALVLIVLVSSTAVFGQDGDNEPAPMSDVDTLQGIDAPMDQVLIDDFIVDGSICVGFDCVNNESFGYDTVRLKENNLRIRFYDTSNSGSFPSNDWQLVANDSTNGGLNYFAIEDATAGRIPFRILAGAPANSLYLNAQGNVGLGTAAPVTELHLYDDDTPTIRLEQNGTSGWTPQTWDIAGNESYFFIRDVTSGVRLPVKIQKGAPDSSLYLAADGSVILGQGLGPGGANNFYLDANGNLTIPGTLTTGGGTVSAPIGQTDDLQVQIEAQQSEIDSLRQENADLSARLAELELLVQSLAEAANQ
ncbi:MAG: hypothetical protein H6667_15170 [Ardenticatenaceae bacterium]|nr:hypothetical protein [Ardenticatenaceae bacterium]MCB9446276.1 hypothetical protein [Ardenticatenaceae bacterium]